MTGFSEGYAFYEKNVSSFFGALTGNEYVQSVQNEIDILTKELNAFSGFKTDISALKGDVAEFWHSGTHNIDAAVKGANARTIVDRSHDFSSADITSNLGESYGLKYYKTGVDSAKAQSVSVFERYSEYKANAIRGNRSYDSLDEFLKKRGYEDVDQVLHDSIYSGQIRIIPKDQLADAVAWLERKIKEESAVRPEQVNRYQETLNLLQDRIRSSEGTESIALSREDAEKLARLAKEGDFQTEDYGLTTEELIQYKYIMEQAFKAGMTAATLSMALRVAPEIYRVIVYLIKHGEIDAKQFQKMGFAAIQAGAEGFIRGALAAGITTACKAGLWGEAFKSIHPSVIGAVTVLVMDVMKNAFFVVTGKIKRGELVEALIRNLFVASCSLVLGGITQCVIGIPVLGFMIGSFVGSVIGSFAYSATHKAYMSFCIDTGFTMFGIVEQDYTLPADVLNHIGLDTFDYEKFKIDKFEYAEFEHPKFEYDQFNAPTIDIKILRRGVIGVNQIGYVS